MGLISPGNTIEFVPADNLYAKIKRTLRSYKNNNLIDDGEFNEWTAEVLKQLGLGVYRERQAVITIKDYKAKLPEDFKQWYSGYIYHPGEGLLHHKKYFQGGWVFFRDITREKILTSGGCELHQEGECLGDGVFEKLTVREYISQEEFGNNDGFRDFHFHGPMLLHLSPNVKKNKCDPDEGLGLHHRWHHRHNEAMVEDGWLYTNTEMNCVALKYYGFPLDLDTNTPMIPDVNSFQRAIESYIIWKLFMSWYWNDEVPNVMQKAKAAEDIYKRDFAQALYEVKLPSFQTMCDKVRLNKGNFAIFRSQDVFGSWQKI